MAERTLVVDANAISRTWALTAEAAETLRAAAPPDWRVCFVSAPTSSDGDGPPRPNDEVMAAIVDAEVYLGFGIPRLLFLEAERLRWVHSAAAGVGSALYREMVESDVVLTNSAGIHAVPIAEYIIAGVLHFFRGLDFALDQQRGHTWSKQAFVGDGSPLREISGSRILIVGAGGIGTETARRFAALGARCIGVRRRPALGAPAGFERVIGVDGIDAELPDADVVVIAAPLTGETNGLMTAARLDLLPRSAVLVNVARGALVEEAALIERLTSGRLRGAVLDVFQEEPLAATSALWQLRSAVVTPHISPVSPGRFWPRQLELFLDNWKRYQQGAPLRNVVDKLAGY